MSPELSFLIKGIVIGFSIAAPVGPIGVLCIRRTLNDGYVFGFVSGLGAATADALYGCIAASGLTLISNFLIGQQMCFRLLGGFFLFFLGVKTFLSRPIRRKTAERRESLISSYSLTFLLTLTNPITIISFAAIFAGLGLVSANGNYTYAGALVSGVFIGSTLWWFILSSTLGLLKKKIEDHRLRWINRFSGITITSFGLVAIFSVTYPLI